MNSEKKKRSANFSEQEVELLCRLVVKYADNIESKKTDSVTWREKNKSWEKLTAEFNFKNKGTVRTHHNLKTKYEGIKKELRKKVSRNKQELFKTGGGVADISSLTNYEEMIYNLITLSVEGLPARFDDDNIFNQEPDDSIIETEENIQETEQETIYIELGDNNYETTDSTEIKLVSPKKKRRMELINNHSDLTYIETNSQANSPPTSPSLLSFQTKKVLEINKKNENDGNLHGRIMTEEVNKENINAGISPTCQRNKWNPKLLQMPKAKELNVKKKNLLTKLQAAEKVSILSQSKTELIQLQIKFVEKELEHVDQEHELKLLKLKQELKNIQLDGKIKELEITIKEHILQRMTTSNNFP